jgi:hypothetical protein
MLSVGAAGRHSHAVCVSGSTYGMPTTISRSLAKLKTRYAH